MSGAEMVPVEPTGEQCSARHRYELPDGKQAMACWYPQMGGFVGKCVVVFWPLLGADDEGGCFEAHVWHDGEFPFGDRGGNPRAPRVLHHCDAGQFVAFGEAVEKAMGGGA